MKRKLIKRNKKRLSTNSLVFDSLFQRMKKQISANDQHKYNKIIVGSEAKLFEGMVVAPVYYKAKNKRSRIQKKLVNWKIMSLDEYNLRFSTEKSLEDFPKL